MRLLKSLPVAIVVLCLFASALMSQTSTGSISGVVTDSSGAVVPAAKVTVTEVEKGISRTFNTDSEGRYQAAALIPGNYQVEARMEGFQTALRKGIELTVGLNVVINLMLQVGQVAQTTEVTAQAPLVETVTGTVSGLVDSRAIRDLPLNARSFDQLIALESSAPQYRYRSSNVASGTASGFTVNGARPGTNAFLMDGVEVVGASASGTLPGGALGINMGVDAIQEFTVLTSNYSAAFGKKAGGAVNIATRSGTNALHGSAFEFLRNSDLDARGFFDPDKPSFKRNQFGASLGGPILKDKTFFFGNYEGLRQPLGETLIATVPDANARQGLLPGPNGTLLNVGISPAVIPYLALFPAPNGRNFGNGTALSLNGGVDESTQNFFLVRVDHRLSDKDTLFVRYNFTDSSHTTPNNTLLSVNIVPDRDQVLTLQESRSYASFMNVARVAFVRSRLVNGGGYTVSSLPPSFLPGSQLGSISFGSASQAGVPPVDSVGANNKWGGHYVSNQFEYADQMYYYRGAHSFQFGTSFQRIQHNDNNATTKFGQFQFSDVANFLAAKPTQFKAPTPQGGGGDGSVSWRQNYFASFVQDDWKVRKNLTLNLGVRYEFLTAPVEAHNRKSNYLIQLVNGVAVLQTDPVVGGPVFNTNFGTVGPRVGFGWDVFGDGKTAIRGGFGIYYDQIEKDATSNLLNSPFYTLVTVTNPPFPLGFSGGAGKAPTPAPNLFDPNNDAGTKLNYNFGIERQVTTDTLFKIGYVGAHAYHLVRQTDINVAQAQYLPGGVVFYPAGSQRKNPKLGDSRYRDADADSHYNSLHLDLIQRPSHGLRYKLSYTFAKSMDTSSGNSNSDTANNSSSAQQPDNLKGERSLSAFDIRHSFVANFTYDVPGQKFSGIAGRLMSGWQLGTIITYQTGNPFEVIDGFNRSNDQDRTFADRPNLLPGASNHTTLGSPDKWYNPAGSLVLPPPGFYGNLGRNTYTGPAYADVDFSLVRIFSITERFKLDFRAEFYNLLNHPSFGAPNLNAFNTNGTVSDQAGVITSTNSIPRQIQFGLKLLF